MNTAEFIGRIDSLRRAEPARALAAIESGFAAASRRADAAGRGALWRTRGHVLRSLRRMGEAARAYRRAAAAYAAAGDPGEQGRCAIGLVDALMYVGRHDEARRAAAEGRRLLIRAGDRAALARLLNNEGNLWHRLDLPERALACYRDAARTLQRIGDRDSARMIGVNIGNCLSLLGRLDEARRHYRAAERAQRAAGALNEALSAEYNLAYLDFLEHRYESSLEGLARVRSEALSRGYPSLGALVRLDRAEILLRMGAHEEALAEADSAAAVCGDLSLDYESAKSELFAALARHRLGRAQAAKTGIQRALTRFDALGNSVWAGESLVGLATIWNRQGNPLAAAALLAAARRRFELAGDRERTAAAAAVESRALLASGSVHGAKRLLARFTGPRAGSQSARLSHLMLGARAALARHQGHDALARRLLRRAAAQAERLAARILDEEWRASFWGEWGWPHRELAMLELGHGDADAALEALEAGRGRALLGRASVRSPRGDALPASVRRWSASRQARDRAASRSGTSLATGHGLRRVLSRRMPRTIAAAELRRVMPAGGRLLDFMEHEDTLGALVVTRERITGTPALATLAHVGRLTHSALFALRSSAFEPCDSRTGDAALDEALTELAALVLWPLLEGRSPSGLAVAPFGSLARLPWAAMPFPDGRPACAVAPLVVVPGLRLTLHAPPLTVAGRPLLVAVDGGDLDAVAIEADAVRRSFPEVQVLAGASATAARFLELAPQASWIHFAGHGAYRADAPQESGLRLADRWLLAGELASLSIGARWVTLSACHTARALVRPGAEWFGLARSFLQAGARAVIASQWDVEDAPTAALMADLYTRLARGATPAEALAGAQAARAESGARAYDWSGFVALGGPRLLGRGDPVRDVEGSRPLTRAARSELVRRSGHRSAAAARASTQVQP